MIESTENFSADALDEFLVYLATKSLMPKPTVAARRAACSKMLGVLEPSERQDIRKLDLDKVTIRFENREGKNYTPDSLKTYKSRASKAIEDFLRFQENPSGFRPKGSGAKRRQNGPPRPDGNQTSSSATNHAASGTDQATQTERIHRISIPVPIRENLVVHISNVPFDLSKSEGQKIANVIMAMASE